MKARDWLGRVAMLVLAVLVTLSIIASIWAIPSGSIAPQTGSTLPGLEDIGEPPPQDEPLLSRGQAQREAGQPEAGASGAPAYAADALSDPVEHAARWLEAITYALLAITSLAALGCMLLWRIGSALQELARARP